MNKEEKECNWVIRPGTCNSFWGFTPCKPGFNYLSKINKVEDIVECYNGRLCPICGGVIKCNTELIDVGI